MGDELAGNARRLRQGITVNHDTLALEEIRAGYTGGGFLSTPHTLKHMRGEYTFPSLLTRQGPG